MHEPNAAGLERASNNQKSVGVLPPLFYQLSESILSYLSCRRRTRFGVLGSRHFETRDPRPHKVLGSDLIVLEGVSE